MRRSLQNLSVFNPTYHKSSFSDNFLSNNLQFILHCTHVFNPASSGFLPVLCKIYKVGCRKQFQTFTQKPKWSCAYRRTLEEGINHLHFFLHPVFLEILFSLSDRLLPLPQNFFVCLVFHGLRNK
nr:MAG TPA: hypothetical protein [Caudoviricetes sp.]